MTKDRIQSYVLTHLNVTGNQRIRIDLKSGTVLYGWFKYDINKAENNVWVFIHKIGGQKETNTIEVSGTDIKNISFRNIVLDISGNRTDHIIDSISD